MPLRIVFDIPGSIYEGLESPERGESRWAQNWAEFLAKEGHEVICICNPALWGQSAPIPNCTLRPWSDTSHIDCDVYVNCCWWEGKDIGDITAKTYVHLSYGFEDHLTKESMIGKNHVIAYPYVQSKKNFIHDRNIFQHKTFCLPVPLADSFREGSFDNKTLTFSAKDVFLDRHSPNEEHWFTAGHNVLKAIKEVSEKHSLNSIFLMAHELTDNKVKAVENLQLVDLLKSINNAQFFPLIKMDAIYKILDITKVLTPVISPGGSMIEGVMRGIIPLTWSGSLFDDIATRYDFLLSHDASYEAIQGNLDRLVTDREFYGYLVSEYQAALEGHLYYNSRKYFQQLVDFME